jgi:hypothetical protein
MSDTIPAPRATHEQKLRYLAGEEKLDPSVVNYGGMAGTFGWLWRNGFLSRIQNDPVLAAKRALAARNQGAP